MNPIQRAFLKTPIGFVEVTGSEKGICGLCFLDFRVRIHRVPSLLKPCIEQLEEYFAGTRKIFDLPLDLSGTPFQLGIWSELQKIPYGATLSYIGLARRIGHANALRAVGGANRRNPVPIIIPCHRVLGHDGKLVGYAGGLWRKKWLLEHEHAFAQRDLFYMKA
ncbi:MAG: methylated-DNA--[protein]-cysteine S-methyltransferase [Bacteroidales bacterium]|jgi:methylated-DNA-[protein]-cysteine S-methyltransferase|nr:methylated-DNA--[protein]-cysteine S-methyltransferase [Bacteroidales bacterium]